MKNITTLLVSKERMQQGFLWGNSLFGTQRKAFIQKVGKLSEQGLVLFGSERCFEQPHAKIPRRFRHDDLLDNFLR